MGYTLGIDFGTSTTKVALRREGEPPRTLLIGAQGQPYMPSLAAYRRTPLGGAELLAVGEDAAAVPDGEGLQVIREIKRCLAAIDRDAEVDVDLTPFPWWDREEHCLRLWGATF